jgi:hypothetical protein
MLSASVLADPLTLAAALDEWALKREKVLQLLDIQGARAARRIASRCRAHGRPPAAGPISDSWKTEWWRLREIGAALLGLSDLVAREPDEDDARDEPEDATRIMTSIEQTAAAARCAAVGIDADEVRIVLGYVPGGLSRAS